MTTPQDLRFLKSHEWARKEGAVIVVGVSDFAVEQLNREIVFVELPELGRAVEQGETFGVIEAVKAASDLFAPVGGRVVAVNSSVSADASIVGNDPQGDGWLIKIEPSNPADWESLLTAEDYEELISAEGAH